jgi:hypothetical protein
VGRAWSGSTGESDTVAWTSFDEVKSCWKLEPAYRCTNPQGIIMSAAKSARFWHAKTAGGQVMLHENGGLYTHPESFIATWPSSGDFCWNMTALGLPIRVPTPAPP